ncbi:hypothetical protein C8R45DRAFT_1096984 [Mycena sanguinolenta]|nr:hypothetical protein C8R45DRAFT_1096984 [Mycena sanguinolenta]
MSGAPSWSSPPTTVFGKQKRDINPLCGPTCLEAAQDACPECDPCTNADLQFEFFSCVKGECQPSELEPAQQALANVCGTVTPTTKPTVTTPFLPANTNADISSASIQPPTSHTTGGTITTASVTNTPNQSSTSITSTPDPSSHSSHTDGGTSTKTLVTGIPAQSSNTDGGVPSSTLINGAPTQSPSAQTVSPSPSPSSVTIQMVQRKSVRAGYIAGSIVAGVLIITLVALFRVRRRRQRIRERRDPVQFLASQDPIVQPTRAKTVNTQAGGELANAEVDQCNLPGASVVAMDAADLKHPDAQADSHDDSANTQSPSSPIAAPAESAPAPIDPPEATRDGETTSLRLRRVEAQLAALLASASPDSSPPSYC